MPFNEDLIKALSKIENEELRATVLNEVEQAHALDVGGLKDNKDAIKKEKEQLKARLDEVTNTLEGLGGKTIEDFNKLEANIAELTANPGDEEKLRQIEEKYKLQLKQEKEAGQSNLMRKEAEVVEAKNKLELLNKEINKGLSQQELTNSLERVNVKPELKPMLTQALQNDVYVDIDTDGKRRVKFRHKGINFDIMDGIDTWAGAPENKIYIGAVQNRGAGANGSSGRGSGLDKPFSEMTYEERVNFHKRDPEGYKQAKASAKK